MRLAALDVGTNSVHLVIADVGRDGNIDAVDRVKETVRLGRRAFKTGRLTEEAMDHTVRALVHFKRLIELRRVSKMRAVATSAVREARNAAEFVARIQHETGIKVDIIPGQEEARLIFVAARHAMGLEGGPHLLVDIGGGSVELVLVRDAEPLWMRSLQLGVSRITEEFFPGDPPTAKQIRELESHLHDELNDVLKSARRDGVEKAIGTSGTINTIVAMARAARGEELGRLHAATASAGEVAHVRRQILERELADRVELPGMDAKRADLMPAAAIITDWILRHSGAPELVACSWALREGLLLELAGLASRRATSDARRHSIAALAQKFERGNDHGRHVAKLAGELFDATAPGLGLPWSARELLEHAAVLHDIGHAIDHDRHNRHTYYMIKNAELFGFDPDEIELIAQIARGHRKQGAKADPELKSLPEDERRTVRALAAILRVADALDRTHFGVVRDIKVSNAPGRLFIDVDSNGGGAELEMWASERRTDLLAKLLGRKVIVRQNGAVERHAGERLRRRA